MMIDEHSKKGHVNFFKYIITLENKHTNTKEAHICIYRSSGSMSKSEYKQANISNYQ